MTTDARSRLTPGLRAEVRATVTPELTASSLGSGDVPALGTPAVLALMERAACDAVAGVMEDGATSVGVWAEIEHVAASKIGAEIVASAVLERADARSLEFTCDAREGERLVARGRHRRAIVDRGRFLERL